jgi:hypothetical protein
MLSNAFHRCKIAAGCYIRPIIGYNSTFIRLSNSHVLGIIFFALFPSSSSTFICLKTKNAFLTLHYCFLNTKHTTLGALDHRHVQDSKPSVLLHIHISAQTK